MSRQIATSTRHLPAELTREVEKIGCSILRALDRLGFVHTNHDGTVFTVRFEDAALFGDELAVFVVDTERLWHFSVGELGKPRVVEHLAAVVHRPVKAYAGSGLAYLVRLKPAPPVQRLPKRIDLDLSRRPAGEYVIGLGLARDGLVWRELGKLGHVIVAGSSDSGKSAFLRALVYQLARQPLPVELYLADMEGLTFEWARDWPIVKGGIAQDVQAATELTRGLLAEIDRRAGLYRATGRFPESLAEFHAALIPLTPTLSHKGERELAPAAAEGEFPPPILESTLTTPRPLGVRSGQSAFGVPHQEGGDRLAWIVAIFDEFSALVEAAGKRSELVKNLGQLAMRSRKFGVTLVFAGQDFKANLLDTRITNQLKTRVQFRCARRTQSKVVLGQGGAEAISVPGRALVRLEGQVVEMQTFWVGKNRVVNG